MNKFEMLVIHCTDTPYQRPVSKDTIKMWHTFPCKNANGTITYMGKTYKSISELPDELVTINGKSLSIRKNLVGRGWKKVGYSDLIEIDGKLTNLVPYNFDEIIDSAEVTNGAAGYNSVSRHVVLAGGWSKDGKTKSAIMNPADLYSSAQLDQLADYIKMQLQICPTIKVVGHNELCSKTCPNFNVDAFLAARKIEVPANKSTLVENKK